MNELIQLVYEDSRQLLISTGRIEENIAEIQNLKVKYRLSEMIKTVQADLMILIEFLYEINNVDFDSDLEMLLNQYQEQQK